jgi:hypothetical protein
VPRRFEWQRAARVRALRPHHREHRDHQPRSDE